jgi:hypothetical protein
MASKSIREKQDERRAEKLAEVQRQIDDGSLKVRQMTPEERKQNPPRERPAKRRR